MPNAPAGEPLRPVELHILLTLARGARHGYAIIQETEAREGGDRLETATLYRALRRLVRAGHVRPTEPPADADRSDRRRRYYAITPAGRAAARDEAARLARLVSHARAARLLPGEGRSR